jgi:hypothetical protein
MSKKNQFKQIGNGKILTPVFRLSFPELYEKGTFEGDDTGWGCDLIFDNDDIDFSAKERWGDVPKRFKDPIRDGSDRDYEGFGEGTSFCTARNKRERPILKNKDGKITIDDTGEFYGGCYCRASISAWAYDHPKGGKGVAFNLHQVKKIEDGERFSQGIDNAGDDFGDGGDDDFEDTGSDDFGDNYQDDDDIPF